MTEISPYRAEDLDDLYRIALATGDSGADASALYKDPKLVGHVYAAPYALLDPQNVLVAADGEGVAGYIVGPADTKTFEARLEADWWPNLRLTYRDPVGVAPAAWTRDELMRYLIHHPFRAPQELVELYPAHLHMNLLPRLQGQNIGRQFMTRWLALVRARGATGAHLGVGASNARAVHFYKSVGFHQLAFALKGAPGVLWFGISLG